jgi:hypothetical protein
MDETGTIVPNESQRLSQPLDRPTPRDSDKKLTAG